MHFLRYGVFRRLYRNYRMPFLTSLVMHAQVCGCFASRLYPQVSPNVLGFSADNQGDTLSSRSMRSGSVIHRKWRHCLSPEPLSEVKMAFVSSRIRRPELNLG